MALLIEDYALIGNRAGAGLVGRDGSLDWLCLPRFDAPACFAALLGGPENGTWRIAPTDRATLVSTTRAYREGTLVLETTFVTTAGNATLTDALCLDETLGFSHVVRTVRAAMGHIGFASRLSPRFGYGVILPLVESLGDGRFSAVAGPDRLTLTTDAETRVEGADLLASFTVEPGSEATFVLTCTPSPQIPAPADARTLLARESAGWQDWTVAAHLDRLPPAWRPLVTRSLLTLRALTHAGTGGIVAAPTTSLPEAIGGPRNWDYRCCWLRDASLTLAPLLAAGFLNETRAWRDWLVRTIAGNPAEMQILYGLGGERRVEEYTLDRLAGYEDSRPVRVGNAASGQVQLDVFGEVLDLLYQARTLGLPHDASAWRLETVLLAHLETLWREPDEGIWEVRGGRRHFTASKAMAWVAFDRAIRTVEEHGLEGPVEHWRGLRGQIHAEVCARGFDSGTDSFTQSYGSQELDASLLLLAPYGFLPASDPRIVGTVRAIEAGLLEDGFVKRYREAGNVDGLAGGREGAFLPCSFWLADNYILAGRLDEARALFERLAGLANDVGLFAEEYDGQALRMLGNFPQAFTHAALVSTAFRLGEAMGPTGGG